MSVENPETANGTINETKPINGDQPMNGLSNGHISSGAGDNRTSSSKHKSSSKDKHRDRERSDHKSSKSSSSNREKDSDRHKHSSSSSGKDKHRDKDKTKSSSSSHHKSSREKDRERDKDKDKSKEHRSNDTEKDKNRDKERSTKDDKLKEISVDNKDKDRKKEHKSSSGGDKERKERSSDNKDKEKSDRDKSKSSSSTNHKSSSSTHHHSSSSNKHSTSNSSKSRSDKDKHHSSSSSSKDKDRHRRDKDRHRSSNTDKDKSSKESRTIMAPPQQVDGFGLMNKLNNDLNDMKELKVELDILPNNFSEQTCADFPNNTSIKEEKQSPMKINNSFKIKEESFINISQASSCDYSMSQFRDDEPNFPAHIKRDNNDYDDNSQNGIVTNSATDPLGLNDNDEDEENGGDDPDFNGAGDDDEMDEEDIPLAKRKVQAIEPDSEDDVPLMSRKKIKKEEKTKKKKQNKREMWDDEDDYDEKPKQKKIKKEKVQIDTKPPLNESPTKGRKKKEDEPDEVWRWWEEEKRDDGVKWNFLEHKGPVFAPLYERLPSNVKFYYDGKHLHLSEETEEVACFYAKMLNHDYVTKKQFNENFFKDFRKSMTSKEKDIIKDLKKCNFKEMNDYFTAQSEKNKNRSKQEKLTTKEQNEALIKEYGFCTIDGHKEKIGNFKLEPPGLFRGRGEHPKMGLVKRRIRPEDVLINCSKNSKIPVPPKGHKWKEVRHDNNVTWLASWVENVQGQVKYIMLNPSSKLKGEKDHQKYEVARRLDKQIDKIRSTYREEWKSKEMRIRQRGVALYFIDKLALRAGNEKDEDQADTVGCCSLRVEHVALHKKMNDKENVVVFDFLGKDSIRYYNEVEVEKRVFKNLELFMENKKGGDELFDRLNTSILNDHLRDLMEGLTAKVFRTYNASITLQNQLNLLTDPDSSIPEKLLAYNRANRAVAVLCNHQRSVPKSHEKSMENLKEKIRVKRELIDDGEMEYEDLKKQAKRGSVKEKLNADKKLKQLQRLKEQLQKLELQETDRDENKTIALGTSKLNYLDPRISVAWCKKNGVPLEKIFNKTQRDKFRWAIHMADEKYVF